MGLVRVAAFTVSLDGFGAGPHQTRENPLGVGGQDLHQWMLPTKTFQEMIGNSGGSTGRDNVFAEKSFQNIGANIMGRNMFGPNRGPWPNADWKGWWGDNPPYHTPVFVLTHHPREPLEMEGGTTFYFVTEGIEAALESAKQAAKGKDVRINGGVDIVRQYLKAGLVDELHLAYSPIYLGTGESLLAEIDLQRLGFHVVEKAPTDHALHVVLRK